MKKKSLEQIKNEWVDTFNLAYYGSDFGSKEEAEKQGEPFYVGLHITFDEMNYLVNEINLAENNARIYKIVELYNRWYDQPSMTANDLFHYLKDLKKAGYDLKTIKVNIREDRDSDVSEARVVEEDLFDENDNTTLTSIVLIANPKED
jgi:hypothetical protein|tara:strand:+ start:2019 stop:2462 length:444 start_codon:yes stop_codon:yes gene_type:complete